MASPEYEKHVKSGAEDSRWQNDVLGYHHDDFREKRTDDKYAKEFLDKMDDVMKVAAQEGKTSADYYSDVNKQIGDERTRNTNFEETQFYKNIEENSKISRNNKEKFGEDRLGVLKELVYRFTHPWTMLQADWSRDNKGPIKNWDPGIRAFKKNLKEILEKSKDLDKINATLMIMKDNLARLEGRLSKAPNKAAKEKTRGSITKQQQQIKEIVNLKVSEVMDTINEKRSSNNVIMRNAKVELKKEARKILEKWGGRVGNLINTRQAYIEELGLYSATNTEHFDKRQEITEKIENIERELNIIQNEIIEYKSERSIFMFEDTVGVISFPILHRYNQVQSLTAEKELEGKS